MYALSTAGPWRFWALALGIIFTALAVFVPSVLSPLKRVWLALGHLLGRITNPIIIGIFYALIVTPLGIISRLSGKDRLALARLPQAPTYWVRRHPAGPVPESMKNQY